MAVQFPSEVVGTACGVLVFSFLALALDGLVIWLTWVHRERTSYIALIAYIIFLSTATCIASQLHFYVNFQDVMAKQWHAIVSNPGRPDPQMIISNGAVGVDLGLWYFRQYAFSVASMLVCFWAFALFQSVYGWSAKTHRKVFLRRVNAVGKIVSFTLPILTICLLQAKAVQKSLAAFMFLANVVLMISLAFGVVLMLGILVRYVQARRQLVSWNVRYGNTSSNNSSLPSCPKPQRTSHGIYDRWLMTRFTVAFVVLSIFELTNMLFQFTGLSNNNKDATSQSPDYGAARAKETTVLFLPGPAPSFLLFLVFGTTAPFRKYMYAKFVPKRWQRIPDDHTENPRSAVVLPKLSSISTARSQSLALPSPSSTQQHIAVQLMDLEKGGSSRQAPSNSSDDTLPMLPMMKPIYHRTHIRRVTG